MEVVANRKRIYVSGEPLEFWENPEAPFGCNASDLERYAAQESWISLFNALVLASTEARGQFLSRRGTPVE